VRHLVTPLGCLLLAAALLATLFVSLGGDGNEYWWSTETAQKVMGVLAGCLVIGALVSSQGPLLRAWLRVRRGGGRGPE
jgi:hypothetical protein